MAVMLEVTLIGISYGHNLDGGPLEISGHLYAKTLYQNQMEKESFNMFSTDTPVTIGVGEMHRIGSTARVAISRDQPTIFARYIRLGGYLSIGSPRHIDIDYVYYGDLQHFRVIFPNQDVSKSVVAQYSIRWLHPI
ncbi:hypothetical protein [Paenibacillus ehimensis]|uniref:Uncharacterized protein n=1 Tax=Paenibacillus ehimensis TaxID=79264 RepID=A0ABT8V4D7_9BACL|nr:hypothetical protein [Paenibacillus ehimensis]MDO3676290.1 hypothetical protein [Paenibacillus ehimensis]MEC0210951.1 hypothetical protein [Paenibacillus ehimensis]